MKELEIALDENGNKVVVLPDIIFSNKQNIDWNEVEKYLKRFVGEIVEIVETGDVVYLGSCLVVNCTGKGKMYLYDLVDIKKEASNPLRTNR